MAAAAVEVARLESMMQNAIKGHMRAEAAAAAVDEAAELTIKAAQKRARACWKVLPPLGIPHVLLF